MITSEYGDGDEDYVDTSLGLHLPRLQFDDDGADIYIMMKCLSVCNEKSSLPPRSLL